MWSIRDCDRSFSPVIQPFAIMDKRIPLQAYGGGCLTNTMLCFTADRHFVLKSEGSLAILWSTKGHTILGQRSYAGSAAQGHSANDIRRHFS